MAMFGIVTKNEHEKVLKEIETLKAALPKYEEFLLETARAEKYNIPDPGAYYNQADLYRKLSWVLLAVDITASAAALTPFSVGRVMAEKAPKDIPNHPFELLLKKPNPMDSRFEFLYATIAYHKLNGNSIWWLNCEDEHTPPDEMWIIPPYKIVPIPDENMYLRGYMYYPGTGAEIFIPPHQIVHFKRFNPFSPFVGLSAIESIAMVANGDLAMQEYNTTLFGENNGRLPSVMTFEQMIADPTWNKIKDDTREAAKNREMLMLRGVGQGGVNWLQNAVSQRDMEYIAGRTKNKEEIMTTVAPGSFTMLSENSTQANSVVGRATFYDHVYGMQVMMGEKITASILKRYGGRELVGTFDDIRVVDVDKKLREQEAYERSHVLKEVREEFYGDDPLGDERDELLISELGKATPQAEPQVVIPENNTQPNEVMPQQPDTNPQDDTTAKAVREEMNKFMRRALNNPGKAVTFRAEYIPQDICDTISAKLAYCKSQDEIKRVFGEYQVIDESRVALTLDALRAALRYQVKG